MRNGICSVGMAGIFQPGVKWFFSTIILVSSSIEKPMSGVKHHLSNGGEEIQIIDSVGENVLEFSYRDD